MTVDRHRRASGRRPVLHQEAAGTDQATPFRRETAVTTPDPTGQGTPHDPEHTPSHGGDVWLKFLADNERAIHDSAPREPSARERTIGRPPRRPARPTRSASGPGTGGRPQQDRRRPVAARQPTADLARTRPARPTPSRSPAARDGCGHMSGARGLVDAVHHGGHTGPRPGRPYDPAGRGRTGRRPRVRPGTRRCQADADRLHRVRRPRPSPPALGARTSSRR